MGDQKDPHAPMPPVHVGVGGSGPPHHVHRKLRAVPSEGRTVVHIVEDMHGAFLTSELPVRATLECRYMAKIANGKTVVTANMMQAFGLVAAAQDNELKTNVAHINRDLRLMREIGASNNFDGAWMIAAQLTQWEVNNKWRRDNKQAELPKPDVKKTKGERSKWRSVLMIAKYPAHAEIMRTLAEMKASNTGVRAVAAELKARAKKNGADSIKSANAADFRNIIDKAMKSRNKGRGKQKKVRASYDRKSLTRGALPNVAKRTADLIADLSRFKARFVNVDVGVTKAGAKHIDDAIASLQAFAKSVAPSIDKVIKMARTNASDNDMPLPKAFAEARAAIN